LVLFDFLCFFMQRGNATRAKHRQIHEAQRTSAKSMTAQATSVLQGAGVLFGLYPEKSGVSIP
jgi:hypothetical protein